MTEETTAANDELEHARTCYDQRRWAEAFAALLAAERNAPLAVDDLERLAWSAALNANDEQFLAALERLHQACVEAGQSQRAARAAFWLGFRLSLSAAPGHSAGWFARASRLVEHEDPHCAVRGYLLLPEVYRQLGAADDVAAQALAADAAQIGERCMERDLVAFARNLQGRALLRQGQVGPGLALLDEVMLAATSGELSPLVTGIVYCGVIDTCQQIYALDRAREWTLALARWCEAQPQLVTFTGICLVHRCEITQLGGAWPQAIEALSQVCEGPLKDADPETLGEAHYQRAEILRLRGDWAEAEASYRMAIRHGHEGQPGIALMRLGQGQTEAAASTSVRVLSTTKAVWKRARQLPAFIEIMLAAGKLDEARRGSEELGQIAREFGTEILQAMAAQARGAVCIADGDPRAAIEPLREALAVWRAAGAPYIAARIRVLLGRAFLGLGDHDGAELELDAARNVFEELGAAPDLAALTAADAEIAPSREHGLSTRELQVLRLVASGKTNKMIARELGVSERTIDRHVSNIFTKLDVPSRAAATAFAYEQKLV